MIKTTIEIYRAFFIAALSPEWSIDNFIIIIYFFAFVYLIYFFNLKELEIIIFRFFAKINTIPLVKKIFYVIIY